MTPEILDLRRSAVRRSEAAWARWGVRPPVLSRLLAPLTDAVGDAMLDRRLASRGPAPQDGPRLVSIGNLVVGGTGKTPVTLDLARRLSTTGRRVAVLTRGYGARAQGPRRVRPDDPDAGDEARLMAASLPDVAVFQASDRAAGLALLRGGEATPDVVLLEDAHQTAGVPRHLDALILDRWVVRDGVVAPAAVPRLPWGPAREGPEGADRARLWLLALDDAQPQAAAAPAGRTVLAFRRRTALAPADRPADGEPWAALSGVARPGRFEADCARLCGRPPALAVRLDDHARYDRRLLARILAAGRERGVRRWLSTAKDGVKLVSLWPDEAPPLGLVSLEPVWEGDASPERVVLELLEA